MLRRSHYIALGLVLLVPLILLNLKVETTARLKMAIGSPFLPLFGLANFGQQLVALAGDSVVSRTTLLKRFDDLRHENQRLSLMAVQAEATAKENERLRHLLGWKAQRPWKLKLAKVVLQEPANWWRTIDIDLGSRDGLTNNLPVLSADGFLVGRVGNVNLTHSKVVLLGDPYCKVSAKVDNESADTGIVGASGPLDRGFAELGFLSRNATLKPGQNVATSGHSAFYPGGIPIGKVVDAHLAEDTLATVARIKLGANLDSLEEVWVLFP